MTNDPRKRKSTSDFWRACTFLYPYRGIVLASVGCAFFVGLAFTGGLGSMMPIMRVLLNHQTIPGWVDMQIAERRLGVTLADDNTVVRVIRVASDKPAAEAGIRPGDVLQAGQGDVGSTLATIASPDASTAAVRIDNFRSTDVSLPRVPRYLVHARNIGSHFPTHPVKAIAAVFAVIATLAVCSNVIKFFQEYLSDKAAVLAIQDIRRRLYDHVLHIPMSHFGSQGTSDVTSRLVQDSQELGQGFKTVLGQSIQEPIKAMFAFGLALWVSWKLTLFIVIFAPVMLVIIRKFGKKMRRASRAALVSSASMLGQIEGTLIGIRVVKGATAERFERRRYMRIMKRLVDEQLRMSRIDAFSAPTMETLTLLVVGSIVLIASYMVEISGTLKLPGFILIMACLGGIGDSLRRVSKVNNVLQKSNAAAARIFEVLELPIERTRALAGDRSNGRALDEADSRLASEAETGHESPPHRVKLPPIAREVSFQNIIFSYPNAPSPALNDVSLTVPKGQSVAVVGRNGSGKTTLLALLPRFYDPQQGRIRIDGVDVRNATLRSLRGQISIVTQDSVIFPGTIADNIAYGQPLADREAIAAAAKRAFAHDFILEKPQGYDTLLGELGGQLSGGQKQRICIARAIFRKASILILDEATSQVDAESEHLIQQAIESLMHERTTFVIAHRFSTILSADTLVVMDRGRIVGQGRHDELLHNCETYQQLYERQLFTSPPADDPTPVSPAV